MRKLVILSCILISTVAATNTAQAEKQENKAVAKRVVQKKINCKGTKQYINIKRKATWNWQDAMYTSHTPTSYADRRTHCSPYLKWQAHHWAKLANKNYNKYMKLSEPKAAICYEFGDYCSEALSVSWCESRLSIWAENGQYLGLFQMGDSERRIFGHGNTALEQAHAANLYFVKSGKDWSPWSCQP